ncbi:MAG: bifunctional oligoribonuclease/PAP phosphatase NrnA [Gemmataceae bacterium]
MAVDWRPFVALVERHQHFLLTAHIRPDGDALGSMLGMADLLRQRGKEVQLAVASIIPPRYDFMHPEGEVKRFDPLSHDFRPPEAVIVLDTGTWAQLGEMGSWLRTSMAEKVVIDHHLTQDDDLQALRLVDTSAEATGRLVYEASQALGSPLSPTAAQAVFVALAMDTGWFRHRNTTAATYDLAARLVELGAQPTLVYDCLFEQNSLGRVLLWARVLSRMELTLDGKVCHTSLLASDYPATGSTPQDSEDLVNYTRSIKGVEVGLFFAEQPTGGIKVSFRSRESVDVAQIAQQFGGGGHRLASGAILPTSLDEARRRVLAAVTSALCRPAGVSPP